MIGVNTNYVLDTNSLIMSLSSRNKYSYIWDAFVTGRYTLCVTNEILTEYEEVISRNINQRVARIVLSYFMLLPNVKLVDPHYSFGLIHADFDDNKFVDCAIVANAESLKPEVGWRKGQVGTLGTEVHPSFRLTHIRVREAK